jgi:hypothetical protein
MLPEVWDEIYTRSFDLTKMPCIYRALRAQGKKPHQAAFSVLTGNCENRPKAYWKQGGKGNADEQTNHF